MRLLIAFVLAFALAPTLRAQGVTGIVRDSLTQLPLPGAVVLLDDAAGKVIARGVTDRHGAYRLPSAPPGARLRVLRLGFRPREIALAETGGGPPSSISLIGIPLLLETVRTVAAANCPRRSDREAALSLLEQVRAGLLASVVARANSAATMKRIRYERRYDMRGTPLHQKVFLDLASVDRPYTAARDAAGFVRDGFTEDSTSLFFAPEAETLIDPAFAAGYCFHVMRPEAARPGQVGLGFQPARRRRSRVDVQGALWVDSTARALTDLEFRYIGLPRELEQFEPGGRISFQEMPTGVPFITSWSIRLASVPAGTGLDETSRDRRRRFVRVELDHTGGQLAEARWPDGTLWRASLGTVRVHAKTSDGRPAANRIVRLLDSSYEAITDSTGVAQMEHVLPGQYTAAVVDSQLAALGIVLAAPAAITVSADSVSSASLAAPTAQEYVAQRCAGTGQPTGAASLLARVMTPDGKSATGAEWTLHDGAGAVLAEGGKVGSDGLIHWCAAPAGEFMRLSVARRGVSATTEHVLQAGLTVLHVTLER